MTEVDDTTRRAIEAVVAEADAMQSDLEGFLALLTDDIVIVNFGGRRVRGKDALREAMGQALASPLAEVTTRTQLEQVRLLRPDVALAECRKAVFDGRSPSADALPASVGEVTFVLLHDGDRWRIASAQTTPILGS